MVGFLLVSLEANRKKRMLSRMTSPGVTVVWVPGSICLAGWPASQVS